MSNILSDNITVLNEFEQGEKMKPRYLKRIFKFILTVLFTAIFLSSCVTKDLSKEMASDVKNHRAASAGSRPDPFGKYDPEIGISFIRGIDNDLSENILPKTPGETIENNRWLKLYKDKLGINVKYAWTVSGNETSDAFTQKITVTLASGDLPDVVIVNPSQLKQLVDSDMVKDMTVYYNNYASDLTKNIYMQEGTANVDSVKFGGRMMAIPETYSFNETAQYLWIRNDWLKKLNLKTPETMEDVLNISKTFTKNDPDGNRADDTYGIPVTKELYGNCMGTEGFFAGYHAYPNMWIEDASGKLVWGSTLPETKTALKKLANMYMDGEIDSEFGIKDAGKVAEVIAAGKIGMNYGQQWNAMYPLNGSYNNDNKADWTGYPIVSADSKKVMVPLSFHQTRIFAVKKTYAHPEAIIKMINLHLEKNWGKTADFNKYYMPAENDSVGVWKFSPVYPNPPFKNMNAFMAIEEARKNNDFSRLEGEAKAIENNIEAFEKGDTSLWGWDKIYGKNGVLRNMIKYKRNNQLFKEKFVGAPTRTMSQKKSALDSMEREVFIKIIMGNSSIDDFDKFVADWNALGGADMTKEVNKWYASVK
jgi:putative aldouronate transport system substrate-binding protein